ncbi:uncharacterized protein B0H18DRAFT_62456 [Fomitopsis serialis]|uniref:uncharacterized protein n=1 Tax=Fomitopsis serialis TaxID=139415 RepID=UPI002008BC29|nr:uncharacterized protein B0H18DRAFT_62456 [Neoantrodia serialis]KAH9916686.1 hypothetical protein B0H18DRAFT_62456 [Neoantrodia serialis]
MTSLIRIYSPDISTAMRARWTRSGHDVLDPALVDADRLSTWAYTRHTWAYLAGQSAVFVARGSPAHNRRPQRSRRTRGWFDTRNSCMVSLQHPRTFLVRLRMKFHRRASHRIPSNHYIMAICARVLLCLDSPSAASGAQSTQYPTQDCSPVCSPAQLPQPPRSVSSRDMVFQHMHACFPFLGSLYESKHSNAGLRQQTVSPPESPESLSSSFVLCGTQASLCRPLKPVC